ncbi:MAG TPA: PspC domain-containing protein [Symbiobacteriaceae bacterium]|jgi:phage shock protein PspC (stress-responsive transcriptional regulator)
MRELHKSRDRKIFGVAGGMAEYFEMDKTIWRALWLVVCIVVWPAVLAYVILGIVMPPAPYEPVAPQPQPQPLPEPEYHAPPRTYKRLTKSSTDRWLFGVAGGIAEYLDVDPVLVRAIFLLSLFFFGTGVLLYLVLAVIMPRPQYQFR